MFIRPLFRIVPDGTRIPFMRGRIMGLITSAILSTASIVLFFYPGLNLGIDFSGGIVMEVRTPEAADFTKLRSSLEALNLGPVGLQTFGTDQDVMIRLEQQKTGGDAAQQAAVAKVRAALDKDFPGTQVRRTDAVGATVSGELFHDGMLALGLALVAMLIYIWFRFEWQFGVGATIATLHDVVTTVGLFAIFQLEFNLTTLAAILTIAGYSINDTVVIYDRVRESMRKHRTMPFRDLINLALNETLSRTILTVSTVALAVVALLIFGGQVLKGFSIAMLWGIVIGTYSSLFIAAPVVYYIQPNRRALARAADASEAGAEGASR